MYDHAAHDPFPAWTNFVIGLGALAVVVLVAGVLVSFNPSMRTGAAAGTREQIGALPDPKAKDAQAEIMVEPGTPAAEGRVLIAQKGCGGCHIVPGVRSATGRIGPSLEGVGARQRIAGGAVAITGPEDLTAWLLDPPALKPGTAMPNVGLTPEEAANITAYLLLLR